LLDLAISVASGEKWWGRRCAWVPVVFVNFELHAWAIAAAAERTVWRQAGEHGHGRDSACLESEGLRGYNADLTLLRPKLGHSPCEKPTERTGWPIRVEVQAALKKIYGNLAAGHRGDVVDMEIVVEAEQGERKQLAGVGVSTN
jgi:hypothetical protein